MPIEDMVIAWPLLNRTSDQTVSALFDLIEDPDLVTDPSTLAALHVLLRDLIVEFGEDHPAVRQVADALRAGPSL